MVRFELIFFDDTTPPCLGMIAKVRWRAPSGQSPTSRAKRSTQTRRSLLAGAASRPGRQEAIVVQLVD
jgi:hypothetical protein